MPSRRSRQEALMLIATPNLCLDITVRVPRLQLGIVARATDTDTSAGGKGVNVARAAAVLGGAPVLTGFLPTADGSRFEQLLANERTTFRPLAVDGELRVATILLEDDGRVTVVNGRGPQIDAAHWQAFAALLTELVPTSGVLVCSGSLPPGVPLDAYRQLTEIGHRAGVPVVVDCAPQVLQHVLGAGPDLVSPNLSEAEGLLLGRSDEQVDERGTDIASRAVQASQQLHLAGARRAVVTAGSAGSALTTAAGSWWLPAPRVNAVNPVGAGDCFAAGAALALLSGATDPDIVRRGMAAASASCETATAGRLDAARAAVLYERIRPVVVGGNSDVAADPTLQSGVR
jgi:1-phosphofructokinase family hexose kinase